MNFAIWIFLTLLPFASATEIVIDSLAHLPPDRNDIFWVVANGGTPGANPEQKEVCEKSVATLKKQFDDAGVVYVSSPCEVGMGGFRTSVRVVGKK